MSARETCLGCGKPVADEEEWREFAPDEGEWLCWNETASGGTSCQPSRELLAALWQCAEVLRDAGEVLRPTWSNVDKLTKARIDAALKRLEEAR